MSISAVSASGAPALMLVKPVIAADSETGSDGVLVKLPPRLGPDPEDRAGRFGATRAAPTPTGADKRESAVVALDAQTTEQEIVGLLSSKVAQAALEVISGIRPVQQLARWLDTRSLSALTTRARLHSEACKAHKRRQSHDGAAENVHTLHHQPIVHSVHCSNVSPGVYESAVVMADKTRFRAVAMRFERERGLWKVTALTMG